MPRVMLLSRALTLLLCAHLPACGTWRSVSVGEVARDAVDLRGQRAEVVTAEGARAVDVVGVRGGQIEGRDRETGEGVSLPLAAVRAVQIRETDQALSAVAMFWAIAAPVACGLLGLFYGLGG